MSIFVAWWRRWWPMHLTVDNFLLLYINLYMGREVIVGDMNRSLYTFSFCIVNGTSYQSQSYIFLFVSPNDDVRQMPSIVDLGRRMAWRTWYIYLALMAWTKTSFAFLLYIFLFLDARLTDRPWYDLLSAGRSIGRMWAWQCNGCRPDRIWHLDLSMYTTRKYNGLIFLYIWHDQSILMLINGNNGLGGQQAWRAWRPSAPDDDVRYPRPMHRYLLLSFAINRTWYWSKAETRQAWPIFNVHDIDICDLTTLSADIRCFCCIASCTRGVHDQFDDLSYQPVNLRTSWSYMILLTFERIDR